MLKDRLRDLFSSYDLDVKTVILEVLNLEQEHISMERPRVKEQIDTIITRIVEQKTEQTKEDKIPE